MRRVSLETLSFLNFIRENRGTFEALEKIKGIGCRDLCWPRAGSSGILTRCALPSRDCSHVPHLSVRPSEQGLFSILISLVAGSQPAGRSKDRMCSFWPYFKKKAKAEVQGAMN